MDESQGSVRKAPTIKDLLEKFFELPGKEMETKFFPLQFVGQSTAATEKRPYHKFTVAIPEDIDFQEIAFGDQMLLVLAVSRKDFTNVFKSLKEGEN
jgi:hypothetical protein